MNSRITKRFSFGARQITENSSCIVSWHTFVRSEEFKLIMSFLGDIKFKNALELGAGDGSQSRIISRYCEQLTCTELEVNGNILIGQFRKYNIANVTYELCDATDLSRFMDSSFDLIFSSNMLEHIPKWDLCLKECKRVLKNKGIMIHIMPSRAWKLWNSLVSIFVKLKMPRIHGIEDNHISEYISFGENAWIKKIERMGLRVDVLLRLPFYHGNGPISIPLILIGNRLGWKSSTAYIIRKTL